VGVVVQIPHAAKPFRLQTDSTYNNNAEETEKCASLASLIVNREALAMCRSMVEA
jgi:hypothetical protein